MAHGSKGGGGHGGGGIEGVAPKIGLTTALFMLTGIGAAIYVIRKNPKSIAPILGVALVCALLLGDSSVDKSPLIGMMAFLGGGWVALRDNKKDSKN